jgi:ATP adenylyltransferase
MKYIRGLEKGSECFLCHNIAHPEDDEANLVVWRTTHCAAMFNRYPYNNGHMLITPLRHVRDFEQTTNDEMLELVKLIRDMQKALKLTVNPHGFNVGVNLGRCAGAGVPEHLHIHIVPRWEGDTGFMSVCTNTEVISQSLDDLYKELKAVSAKHDLPQVM